MSVESKIENRREFRLKTGVGELIASGNSVGKNAIQIEISKHATGMGMNETPGEHATITVNTTDFDEWLSRIANARKSP